MPSRLHVALFVVLALAYASVAWFKAPAPALQLTPTSEVEEVLEELRAAPKGSPQSHRLAAKVCKLMRGPSTVARWTPDGRLVCRLPSHPRKDTTT